MGAVCARYLELGYPKWTHTRTHTCICMCCSLEAGRLHRAHPPPRHTPNPGSESHLTGTSSSPSAPPSPCPPMPTHIPLALPACLLGTALPWGSGGRVEGGHLGMRGGDLRVWTPLRVAQGQGNSAHRRLLGSRLGAQAGAEDAWVLRPGWGWGHGKRWSCLYRGEGGSSQWRAADKSSFVPDSGVGRAAGRRTPLH